LAFWSNATDIVLAKYWAAICPCLIMSSIDIPIDIPIKLRAIHIDFFCVTASSH
jgi:hypothetical protein